MERISKHISYKEGTYSETAIRKGITNAPDDRQLASMKFVANEIFEKCREHFNEPIHVNSFFRSMTTNHAIGGSVTSDHVNGFAIDCRMSYDSEFNNKHLFDYIKDNLEFDQLIWEFGNSEQPRWVHFSKRTDNNRNQILVAKRIDGKVRYNTFV